MLNIWLSFLYEFVILDIHIVLALVLLCWLFYFFLIVLFYGSIFHSLFFFCRICGVRYFFMHFIHMCTITRNVFHLFSLCTPFPFVCVFADFTLGYVFNFFSIIYASMCLTRSCTNMLGKVYTFVFTYLIRHSHTLYLLCLSVCRSSIFVVVVVKEETFHVFLV